MQLDGLPVREEPMVGVKDRSKAVFPVRGCGFFIHGVHDHNCLPHSVLKPSLPIASSPAALSVLN
jgi:hypothetical protein